MNTDSEAKKTADRAKPVQVQLVMNRLWQEQVSADQTRTVIADGMQKMRAGYQLAFPVLAGGKTVYLGVLLVAEHDHRTGTLKIERVPGSTHLVMLLLFKDRTAWQAQVDRLLPLWPEQPEIPASVFVEMQS